MTGNTENVAVRLKEARLAAAYTTREVAELLPAKVAVSHATISNYEKGRTTPDISVLGWLARIYDRPINWFLEGGPVIRGIRYRNKKSRVSVRQLAQFEALASKWLGAYRRLEQWAGSGRRKRELPRVEGRSGEEAAHKVRQQLLKIESRQPVQSTIELLELAGVRVVELPTSLPIDALAAEYGDEHVVVLNPLVPNDRNRLNAAHEFAHILFGDCSGSSSHTGDTEKRAFEFASHLLVTSEMLRKAFMGKSMVRLVQFKERYGISLAAMVYRAEQEGLITGYEAKHLWIEFSRRGWRRKEPGTVKDDRATRFEELIDVLVSSRNHTWDQLARIARVSSSDLQGRVQSALLPLRHSSIEGVKGGCVGTSELKIAE